MFLYNDRITAEAMPPLPAEGVEIEVINRQDNGGNGRGAPSGAGAALHCEVKHSIRGRLRLAVKALAGNDSLVDSMRRYLLTKEGVSGVDPSPRSGQFIIQYSAQAVKARQIVDAVTGLSVEELDRIKDELPEPEPPPAETKEAPGNGANGNGAVSVCYLTKNEKLLDCRIAHVVSHSTHGRLRVTFPLLASYDHLLGGVEQCLASRQGIIAIGTNCHCGSVRIEYDVEVIRADDVLDIIGSLTIRELVKVRDQVPLAVVEDHQISMGYLKLTTAAFGLGILFGAVPVVALAVVYPILLAVCVPVYKRAYRCLKNERRLNVDFLDAAALTTAMLTGDVINASAMCWLIHLGDHIRDLTAASSHRTIRKLLDFQDNYAWVVRGEAEIRIKVRDIVEGDIVALNVGNLIPVDGEIVEGDLIVDQQVLTGESMPIHKEVGETVLASTIIRDGKAYVMATRTGDRTKVAQVVKMVEEAPIYETKIQNHAEKMADGVVAPSLVTTGLLFAATMNLNQLAALLTVDFGTGVRVSAPTAVLSSMIASVSQGILIKGGSYLEKLCTVDTVVFDKTGTLTTGVIKVEDTVTFNGYSKEELLSFAATAELQMTHPIAEAVVSFAAERDVPLKHRGEVKYLVGRGVEASMDGKRVLVGSKRLLTEASVPFSTHMEDLTDKYVSEGKACLYVAVDDELSGVITFRDQIRPEARHMIDALHKVGVKQVIMLTGDVKKLAMPVAQTLGIDRCIAEVLPEEKADVIIDLKKNGHIVAFVGDGINDSVGLSYADIGISVRGGADITKETAGVILLDDDLRKIPKAFEISKETIRLIKENYWITGTFNAFAYALAAVGLVSPVLTTLISNGSAVIACVNGMKPVIRTKLKASWKSEPVYSAREKVPQLPAPDA